MTADTQARLGQIERSGQNHVLRYERHLDHAVERVWAALTEPGELAGWLAAADELELVEGGRIALRWLNAPDDHREWEDRGVELDDSDPAGPARGRITALEPPRLIEYETDKLGFMRWELRPERGGCALTFTNTIELPEGHPPEQTLAGWHIHLDHLAEALDGEAIEWSTWTEDHIAEWAEIRDRYAAELG